jgi:hypothetical protein
MQIKEAWSKIEEVRFEFRSGPSLSSTVSRLALSVHPGLSHILLYTLNTFHFTSMITHKLDTDPAVAFFAL